MWGFLKADDPFEKAKQGKTMGELRSPKPPRLGFCEKLEIMPIPLAQQKKMYN